jgi:hypothetical protein
MMLGEMYDALAKRDLRVKRHVRLEAMLPVGRKTKKIEIKIFCLGLVEDSQDRHASAEPHLATSQNDLDAFDAMLLEQSMIAARKFIGI